MPKLSYGEAPKKRSKFLVQSLLSVASNKLIDKPQFEVTLDGESLCLKITQARLPDLAKITEKYAVKNSSAETITVEHIREIINDYLKDWLAILEETGNRAKGGYGSDLWSFTLKIWSANLAENGQAFEQAWEDTRKKKLKVTSVETNQETAQRKVLFFANQPLPAIPVWQGRENLLEALQKRLQEESGMFRVLALLGQGGIGKTSLAVKLLEAIQPAYQQVFYFRVNAEETSFDEIAGFLLGETQVGYKNADDKICAILNLLAKQPCLLLLDNLETILHPTSHAEAGRTLSKDLGKLLNAFAYGNHKSHVILTSRELPKDLADSRSDGVIDPLLVRVEWVMGVKSEASVNILKERKLKDNEEDLKWVAERVDGQVLILTHLAAFAADKPGYLRKHPELVTKKADPILREQLVRLSEPAKDLLMRMCVLRVGIDLQELTFLRLNIEDREQDDRFEKAAELEEPTEFTEIELAETETLINQLIAASLVESRYSKKYYEDFYTLHAVVRDVLRKEYANLLPTLMQSVYKFYCTGKKVDNPKTLEDIRPVLEAQHFAFQLGNYQAATRLIIDNLEAYLKPWGLWDNLEDLYKAVLPHAQELDRPTCLYNIGIIHRDKGNWDMAEAFFQEALANAVRVNDKKSIAKSTGCLGNIFSRRGNWDEAENCHRKALQLRKEIGDHKGMATSLGSLRSITQMRGNWDEAELLYREAAKIREEIGDRLDMATSLSSLGDIEKRRGNYVEAESYKRQAYRIRRELGELQGMAVTLASWAEIKHEIKAYIDEKRMLKCAVIIYEKLGNRPKAANQKARLGNVEIDFIEGDLDKAEKLISEALSILQELESTHQLGYANYFYARLKKKCNLPSEAQDYYKKAHEIFSQLGAPKDIEWIEQEWQQSD